MLWDPKLEPDGKENAQNNCVYEPMYLYHSFYLLHGDDHF